MTNQVIAIDPGETTGFIVAEYLPTRGPGIKEHPPTRQNIRFIAKGVWHSIGEFKTPLIQQYIKESQHVIIEDYRIYPHKSAYHIGLRPYAIEVIGHVRLTRYPYQVHFQSASQAKQRWPNKRLKAHGLYITKPVHARDALRHLLTYLEDRDDFGPLFNKENAI